MVVNDAVWLQQEALMGSAAYVYQQQPGSPVGLTTALLASTHVNASSAVCHVLLVVCWQGVVNI